MDRVTECPQCGKSVIQPRNGGDYCEECGWPDEDRREGIDILVQWMAKRLNILRNQQPTPVAWAGDRRLGKIAELEFVIRTANGIRGCIYPGEPCCGLPKKECTCQTGGRVIPTTDSGSAKVGDWGFKDGEEYPK